MSDRRAETQLNEHVWARISEDAKANGRSLAGHLRWLILRRLREVEDERRKEGRA